MGLEVKIDQETVVLPAGFEKIPDNFNKKEIREHISKNGLVRRMVKHFSTEVQKVVLFDPNSEEYLSLLDNYKKDDKALGNAIQEIINGEGLPIWTRKTSQPKSKKEHQRVRFMLRPVFTASNQPNKGENTLNWGYRSDLFTLHFDDEHNLQMVRFWDSEKMPPHISDRRKKVYDHLLQAKEEIKEKYGDWKAVSEIMFTIIQNVYGESLE
ncbi:hypothetical protein HN954_01630 [bacterium]|jgi:hypothetical protein|nr:hypothetical protein [bacterium]MBT6831979.1 hypothetical protein [bacterium]MBT6996110.1 hypothetical protein [bacterium]MBT7772645.1 hypothetical protein [bacterium]